MYVTECKNEERGKHHQQESFTNTKLPSIYENNFNTTHENKQVDQIIHAISEIKIHFFKNKTQL